MYLLMFWFSILDEWVDEWVFFCTSWKNHFKKKVQVNALLKASIVTHIGIMEWNKMLRTKNVSA